MCNIISVLEDFPFLIPSFDFKVWDGFIYVEDEEIPITLATPHYPLLEEISLKCPANWESKIQQKLKEYDKLMTSNKGEIIQFLHYLKNKDVCSNPGFKESYGDISKAVSKLDYYLYHRVLDELRQLGDGKVAWCTGDLRRVTLRTVDERGVDHRLVVGLSPDYPATPPSVVDMDLPDIAFSNLSQARTIVEIWNTFEQLTHSFQDFWIVYEELKNNTWLIDPENPRLKDTHCRIIIGENISMLLTLNPQDVNTCPDIKFLGPDNLVAPFINSMEHKLKTVGWNEDLNILENLLSLLGLSQFPQADTSTEMEGQQGECSICFTVRLDNQALAIKVCNNTNCGSYFHISCLAQWFQAVPINEASFNLISGSCPSCGESSNSLWCCDKCTRKRRLSRSNSDSCSFNISTSAAMALTAENIKPILEAVKNEILEGQRSLEDRLGKSLELCFERIADNYKLIEAQNKIILDQQTTIEMLQQENKALHKKVNELDLRHSDLEQYSRRNTLEIFGVPESQGETNDSLKDTVLDIGAALDVTLSKDGIDAYHRINGGNNRPTSGIIVKLLWLEDPDRLLEKKKVKRDFSTRHLAGHTTDSPIYVNISLTPARRVLFAKARKLKLDYQYKYVWVDRAGRVKARKSDDRNTCTEVINNDNDLLSIITKETRKLGSGPSATHVQK